MRSPDGSALPIPRRGRVPCRPTRFIFCVSLTVRLVEDLRQCGRPAPLKARALRLPVVALRAPNPPGEPPGSAHSNRDGCRVHPPVCTSPVFGSRKSGPERTQELVTVAPSLAAWSSTSPPVPFPYASTPHRTSSTSPRTPPPYPLRPPRRAPPPWPPFLLPTRRPLPAPLKTWTPPSSSQWRWRRRQSPRTPAPYSPPAPAPAPPACAAPTTARRRQCTPQ